MVRVFTDKTLFIFTMKRIMETWRQVQQQIQEQNSPSDIEGAQDAEPQVYYIDKAGRTTPARKFAGITFVDYNEVLATLAPKLLVTLGVKALSDVSYGEATKAVTAWAKENNGLVWSYNSEEKLKSPENAAAKYAQAEELTLIVMEYLS